MWGFELSQQCESSFGIIVLQFVSCPAGGCRIQFYSNCAPPTISLQLLLCPWMWGIFLVGFTVVLSVVVQQLVKKEFIGPGLHLRPVCADRAWPPLQWTLSSVLSACGNDKGRTRPPSGQGNLEEEKTNTNHPCLRTVSIEM